MCRQGWICLATIALLACCISGKERQQPSSDANRGVDKPDSGVSDIERFADGAGEGDRCPTAGAAQACSTELSGLCAEGERRCALKGDILEWGACEALLMPGDQAEASPGASGCANGEDDDCDGLTDGDDPDCQCVDNDDCPQGLACIDDLCLPCADARQCAAGEGCVDDVCGTCSAPEHCTADATCYEGQCVCVPSNGGVEICDGLDNDCDGEADEDETRQENHPYQLQRCCNPPDSYWCCAPEHGGTESGDIGDCCTYTENHWVTVQFSCD